MVGSEGSFGTSQLSPKLSSPKTQDLKKLNSLAKRLKARGNRKGKLIAGIPLSEAAVTVASSASFDNLPNHKSRKGIFALLAHEASITDHGILHNINMALWSTGSIRLVVRSTLGAEAYTTWYAVESGDSVQAVLCEVLIQVSERWRTVLGDETMCSKVL